jgi:hypothetical protein
MQFYYQHWYIVQTFHHITHLYKHFYLSETTLTLFFCSYTFRDIVPCSCSIELGSCSYGYNLVQCSNKICEKLSSKLLLLFSYSYMASTYFLRTCSDNNYEHHFIAFNHFLFFLAHYWRTLYWNYFNCILKLFTRSFRQSCGYHNLEELVVDFSSSMKCLWCWVGCLVATCACLLGAFGFRRSSKTWFNNISGV